MGTHPIFESDFDCLTENRYDDGRGGRDFGSTYRPAVDCIGSSWATFWRPRVNRNTRSGAIWLWNCTLFTSACQSPWQGCVGTCRWVDIGDQGGWTVRFCCFLRHMD